jgi:RNA polymerase sigma factor (sigma-70 family)
MTTFEFNHKLISMEDHIERFALSLTFNPDKAKDLLQDTYFKALKYRDKYTEANNFKAWIFTIMKNTFLNDYRRSVREKTSIDITDDLSLLNNREESQLGKPEAEIAFKEINKAIDALEGDFRVPLTMHTEGYKYKEIAENLDLKIGTVKSRIFLARKKLMETLQDYQ